MLLPELRVVLVSPLYGGNVGAVARVAANFGLSDLVLVRPECDWRGSDALRFAKGPAKQRLERMREAGDLSTALAGCGAAVGFTRRTGSARSPSIELKALSALGRRTGRPLALVFGREDAGLTGEELSLCTHVCSLAVDDEMPSLNLSHAVAAVAARLYEDAVAAAPEASKGSADGASHEELAALFSHWDELLGGLELGSGNAERLAAKIRPALARAELTTAEVAAFRAILSKTQVALGARVNRRRAPRT